MSLQSMTLTFTHDFDRVKAIKPSKLKVKCNWVQKLQRHVPTPIRTTAPPELMVSNKISAIAIWKQRLKHDISHTFRESSGQTIGTSRPAASATVGKMSTNSTSALVCRPVSVRPGILSIIGARVASSKLVCLHHSPCSPSCHPWSPINTMTVFDVRFNDVSWSRTCPTSESTYEILA